MSLHNKLPATFEDNELLVAELYSIRDHLEIAKQKDDTEHLRCTYCQGLLLTAYSPYCGHHFCGPCIRKIMSCNAEVNWKCPKSKCPCFVNKSRVHRGESEEAIRFIVLEQTFIKCPWKCTSDILIKNIFNHQLTCVKSKKLGEDNQVHGTHTPNSSHSTERTQPRTEKKVKESAVTVDELKELQEKYAENFQKLETEINDVKQTNDRFEEDIRNLKAKMERMKMFVSKYTSMCNQIISQHGEQNPETSEVLARSTWEIDLSNAMIRDSDAPQSYKDALTQINSHICQMHKLALRFEVSLMCKPGHCLDQIFISFVSVLSSEVDDFHQWPLRATAILKLMDGDKAVEERRSHFVIDSNPSVTRDACPMQFWFDEWSLEEIAKCKSYFTSNYVTMSLVVRKEGEGEAAESAV